ncbi:hypothetical protein [Nostoc sp. 'Peltigera membranacea cyanobiont' N6]|uniref:hypothetical protein n=1 Tax=Nostoc sp. 'Peltigera membranacea cyanobiont' N6 TaxID=1261031 RepID=UPI000CF33778|nr:hypothetical protein [Nostoc sp. 'Peltigera membranacea cyanobiont' N6]AVH63437.1 hypothetical protein NPM_1615 [Nostoc sp. 'Peltigera membranacea cyanobiont' N6]
MTPSVADKTPIPAKVWRRHTDPPGLWISVVIGSVSLHLLAFWLIRSSNGFSLWFPQQSQSAVPVELIDIPPEIKSTDKRVSPKPASTTQKSVSAQTARTQPRNEDFGAINSADNFQQKSRIYASQPNRQQRIPASTPKPTVTPKAIATPKPTVTPKAIATPKPTVTPKAIATPKPTVTPKAIATPKPIVTPTPTVPVGNLPWKRRQEITLGKGTALPTGIPSTPPTPTGETSPTPARETPPPSTRETPSTPTGGASVAIVAPLLRNEMIKFIQTRGFRQDALPDVIASYTGSNAKQLDSSFLPGDSEIKPAQMLVSLIIDRNGKFQQAVVLEIEPTTLQTEKTTYERVLNDVFKTENFLAAHNNDGKKPDLSNLFVRIKIQPANSN